MKRNGSHLRQYLPWLGLLLVENRWLPTLLKRATCLSPQQMTCHSDELRVKP